jgi:hypothetical protein
VVWCSPHKSEDKISTNPKSLVSTDPLPANISRLCTNPLIPAVEMNLFPHVCVFFSDCNALLKLFAYQWPGVLLGVSSWRWFKPSLPRDKFYESCWNQGLWGVSVIHCHWNTNTSVSVRFKSVMWHSINYHGIMSFVWPVAAIRGHFNYSCKRKDS